MPILSISYENPLFHNKKLTNHLFRHTMAFDLLRNSHTQFISKAIRRSFLGKEHRLPERRQQILEAIEKAGQLSVAELSVYFDVSEVTIRQDLQALSEQGLLLRTRGGAVSTNTMPEFSFDVRQQQYAAKKTRIGLAAANLVSPGDTIILDASTTAHASIPYLKVLPELTVITNSLRAAISLLDAPQIQVILPGGHLRRESISLVGPTRADLLPEINVQIGFFGARGVTVEQGLTDVNLNEVAMKQAMVEHCRRVVGMVDARKWGKVAASTFATLEQIDTLITDNDAPADLVRQIQQHQVEVILV
jgi:DeoR/GlpR family transcriptional regulator of sugar metabolism